MHGQWFRDAGFGAFIHWGLFAAAGGVWQGKETEYIGEWLQSRFRIPNREYAAMARNFNPIGFDADLWVKRFRDAGMKYIVFTSKHHEGFAMFRTGVSPYNIVDATPFGRDPLAELAAACKKYGLKLGIYYSQYLDWHEADGGDPGPESKNVGGEAWGNNWDFPNLGDKRFDRYFEGKVIPQITELLTNYGPVGVFWCDCPLGMEATYSRRLRELIHRLQPDCLINSRIGHGCEDYRSLGDNLMPGAAIPGLVECPVTLNDTWGWKKNDHHYKSPEAVIRQRLALAEKGVNLLLNVGPRDDGSFTEETVEILSTVADWNGKNGAALFASQGSPFPQALDFAFAVAKDTALHLYLKHPAGKVTLSGVLSRVVSAEVPFTQRGTQLELDFSGVAGVCPAVAVIFATAPEIDPRPMPQNGKLVLAAAAGTIRRGGSDADELADGMDADGRPIVIGRHMTLTDNGALGSWQNPADALVWEVVFAEPGRYNLTGITQSARHSAAWAGDRVVELAFGNETREFPLVRDAPSGNQYYPGAETKFGEFTVSAPGVVKIALRTVALQSAAALLTNFVEIRLEKITQ